MRLQMSVQILPPLLRKARKRGPFVFLQDDDCAILYPILYP